MIETAPASPEAVSAPIGRTALRAVRRLAELHQNLLAATRTASGIAEKIDLLSEIINLDRQAGGGTLHWNPWFLQALNPETSRTTILLRKARDEMLRQHSKVPPSAADDALVAALSVPAA